MAVRLDDRTIVFQASDDGPDCDKLPTLTADETATAVLVALAFPPPSRGGLLSAGVGLSSPETVTVPSPIGRRPIIDRSTGRPVSVTDERALPQIPATPAGHQVGPLELLDPGTTGPHAVSRTFPTTTSPADTIEVDTWQGDNLPPAPPGDPTAAVDVSGHHATLTHIDSAGTVASSRVEWAAYGQVIVVQTRSDGGVPAPAAANDAAVLSLARSITPPLQPLQAPES